MCIPSPVSFDSFPFVPSSTILTVRQAFKREEVILSNGESGEAYSGLYSITEQACGHFLEVRDVFRFSGAAVSGLGSEASAEGGSLPSLILQPAAMHSSASRKPTVTPVLGSLDPIGLTLSRPRPYQVEVGAARVV